MSTTSVKKLQVAQNLFCKWFLFFICLCIAGAATANTTIKLDTSHIKPKAKSKTIELLNITPDTAAIKKCKDIDAIYTVIGEAIAVGAPTYNEGNPMGCYRIYEGAAYKILYKYGSKCKEVNKILEAALEKTYGDYSPSDRAWIMRVAFDAILGEPTITTTR
jgi:hypothetical protein